MTPLIRIAQNPVVIGPDFAVAVRLPVASVEHDPDPERAYRGARRAGLADDVAAAIAAHAAGLPLLADDELIDWTMRDVRRLRFAAWLHERGAL